MERETFDGGYGVGDGNTRQAAAAVERRVADRRNGVSRTIIGDRCGDGNISKVLVVIRIEMASSVSDNSICTADIVVDAVNFELVGGGGEGCADECGEQDGDLEKG